MYGRERRFPAGCPADQFEAVAQIGKCGEVPRIRRSLAPCHDVGRKRTQLGPVQEVHVEAGGQDDCIEQMQSTQRSDRYPGIGQAGIDPGLAQSQIEVAIAVAT